MTNLELVNLLIRSCSDNPYNGKHSEKDIIICAICYAESYINSVNKGYKDGSMDIGMEQLNEVIGILQNRLTLIDK